MVKAQAAAGTYRTRQGSIRGQAMPQAVAFFEANLVYVLSALLIASVFFSLGLLTRRRHVIQILPAPVSPGLEKAISAALSSREIVYVQPAQAPSVEMAPAKQAASAPAQPEASIDPVLHNGHPGAEEFAHDIGQSAD